MSLWWECCSLISQSLADLSRLLQSKKHLEVTWHAVTYHTLTRLGTSRGAVGWSCEMGRISHFVRRCMRLLSGGRRATGGIREREAKLEARKRREEQVWKKMKTKPGDGRSIWALNLTCSFCIGRSYISGPRTRARRNTLGSVWTPTCPCVVLCCVFQGSEAGGGLDPGLECVCVIVEEDGFDSGLNRRCGIQKAAGPMWECGHHQRCRGRPRHHLCSQQGAQRALRHPDTYGHTKVLTFCPADVRTRRHTLGAEWKHSGLWAVRHVRQDDERVDCAAIRMMASCWWCWKECHDFREQYKALLVNKRPSWNSAIHTTDLIL